MKYILTENQVEKLFGLLSEQMGIGFWAEQVLWGINPESGVGSGGCNKPSTPREVFVEYYRAFKTIAKANDQNIKNISLKLMKSMEGANLSSNRTLLDFFKNNDDATIGSVIMNWKKNTGSPKTLYEWLSGEYLTLWTDLMKSISANPKLKNKNYGIRFCQDTFSA